MLNRSFTTFLILKQPLSKYWYVYKVVYIVVLKILLAKIGEEKVPLCGISVILRPLTRIHTDPCICSLHDSAICGESLDLGAYYEWKRYLTDRLRFNSFFSNHWPYSRWINYVTSKFILLSVRGSPSKWPTVQRANGHQNNPFLVFCSHACLQSFIWVPLGALVRAGKAWEPNSAAAFCSRPD